MRRRNVIRNLNFQGLRIEEDQFICDYELEVRSWRERLFSLPWRPLAAYNLIYAPKAYVLPDGTIIVSPDTKRRFENNLMTMKF